MFIFIYFNKPIKSILFCITRINPQQINDVSLKKLLHITKMTTLHVDHLLVDFQNPNASLRPRIHLHDI